MSMALERSNSAAGDHRVEVPEFAHRNIACASSIYSPPELTTVDRRFPAAKDLASEDQGDSLSSSSSTSSIGKNSDDSTSGVGGDGEEVQSGYEGGPLDNMEALEEVLPVKRSISKFYSGKSKSYTSLFDAACSSIEDITKPENAYTRKRKNLLAFNNIMDKNRNNIFRSSKGGISKRPNNSRSMLSLAATMYCSEPNTGETSYSSNSSPPGFCRPPLPPHARRAMHSGPSVLSPADKLSSWRSFSLSDLQGAAAAEASK
ncbi:hypothetical protein OROGR_029722 [Orobanche gracilis]